MYLHHYSLLVCSLHILLQDCITPNMVSAADLMLQDFVKMLPELYGERSCTANSRLICHLTKYFRLWGPLWTHSAFGFESCNGHLKYLFHSQANIIDQLVFNVDIQQTLQLLQPLLFNHEPDVLEFLNIRRILSYSKKMKKIDDHMYILGKTVQKTISSEERNLLGIPPGTIIIFTRLYYQGIIYHSSLYHKESK